MTNHTYIGTCGFSIFWTFDLDEGKEAKRIYKLVDKTARDIIKENPIALLIQFDGGFIITKETKKETIEKMHEATKIFNNLIEHIKDKPQKEVSVDSSHN